MINPFPDLNKIAIAPSILSANFASLGKDISAVERGGADLIHVDVMDGHFVPNITIGPQVVKDIKQIAKQPLDVHLMISNPDKYIETFMKINKLTLTLIQSLGAKAGVVLNPSTPAGALEEVASTLDFVLVMSVNPGFGGQAFIPHSLSKIKKVKEVLSNAGVKAPIEIDGGIDETNIQKASVYSKQIYIK